jgi:hypothetical protein
MRECEVLTKRHARRGNSPQNLKPRGFSKLHVGQIRASGVVHCPQNFIPSGFSKPHLEQRIPKIQAARIEHSYHEMARIVTHCIFCLLLADDLWDIT